MAILKTMLFAVLLIAVVLSKPICQTEAEETSKSSESNEVNSSEETAARLGMSQEPLRPACGENNVPEGVEESEPTDTTALPPSPEPEPLPDAQNTSMVQGPEDPQTSTDIDGSQLMTDDPAHNAVAIDGSQNLPSSHPAMNADMGQVPLMDGSLHTEAHTVLGVGGSILPQVADAATAAAIVVTNQDPHQGVTHMFPPHVKSTPLPFSPATITPIPIGAAQVLTGVPVCFSFQLTTPEPDPPRGDSV